MREYLEWLRKELQPPCATHFLHNLCRYLRPELGLEEKVVDTYKNRLLLMDTDRKYLNSPYPVEEGYL